MEKDNNKKKKVIIIVISIIIILVLALAISYAYFSTQLSGSDQIVKVGTLDLVLDETSEGITLDNAVGISDSEGLSLDGSTFELRNNGNKAVDYTIYLDDNTIGDNDTRIDDKYLKYNLNKNGADSGATLLTRIGANPNRILDSGTIEEGGTIVSNAVGLLNIYEYSMSHNNGDYKNGYLFNELYWWTLTPNTSKFVYAGYISNIIVSTSTLSYGVRPSINLKPEIKIVSGSGTEEDPYRLMGDNDNNLEGVKLNTRYSGEYITFGTGENNLYQIVSHETDGLTKITSVEPLKENGTFKTMAFGDRVYYSRTNTIGSFLNGEYLNSGTYLTEDQVNMIEDNTTWYLGAVANGQNYKLAKYTDTSMSGYATSTDAKVGLLRLGELMSGQFERKKSVLAFNL